MDIETTSTPHREPVPLGLLALELGTTVDELEKELGQDVWRDAAGLRVVTRFTAAETIKEHARRKEVAEASRRRESAERRARHAKIREKRPVGRGVPAGPEGVPAVAMLTAGAIPPHIEFGGVPPVDKAAALFGEFERGGVFGPTAEDVARQRAAREKRRVQRKEAS